MSVKQILGVISFLVVMSFGTAQTQSIGFGLRGGIDRGYEYGNVFGQGNLRGFQGGAYARFDFIGGVFGIHPEVLFSRRTFSADNGPFLFPDTEELMPNYRRNYTFVDVPVFLRINVTPGFHFLVGPQVSGLLYSREHYYEPEGRSHSIYHSGYENRLDLYGVAGLGYEFESGFNVGFRYGVGLGQIHGGGSSGNAGLLFDRQAQLVVGYTFLTRGKE
ncbi:outer membrane beta-barrel protein [Cytophagaceae bacterium ABcell3]|nr:outer membrane beta-barrel protein [Cytophagaceae bacterium ABcell3]